VGQRMVRFLCLTGFLVIGSLALAQDFSADVFSSKQSNNGDDGKLYSTKDKIRWEFQERSSKMGRVAIVVDEAQGKSFALLEQQHMYMDSGQWMTKSTPMVTRFWHVQDVNDACPQWKKIAEQWKTDVNWGSCTRVGSDTVNGRSTVKYEGVNKKGERTYYWVDTNLKCVIKTDSAGSGGMELRNIKEAPQPASLFSIPAGYTKFDMGAMMPQR